MPDRGAVFKPRIDANLPLIKSTSLHYWNGKFRQLSNPEDQNARDLFALTGHYLSANDDTNYRMGFDVSKCEVRGDMKIEQISDIDSVIGILPDTIPIKRSATLKYYMVPDPRYTLDSNLHIPGVHVL